MNHAEWVLQKQFEGLLPKVVDHGKGTGGSAIGTNYDWIIMERVNPIVNSDEFDEHFPILQEVLKGFTDGYRNVKDFFYDAGAYRMGLQSGITPQTRRYYHKPMKIVMRHAMRDPLFAKIVKIMDKVNADLKDITVGNVGVTEDGEFRILDASVFDYPHWPEDEEKADPDDEVRFDAEF